MWLSEDEPELDRRNHREQCRQAGPAAFTVCGTSGHIRPVEDAAWTVLGNPDPNRVLNGVRSTQCRCPAIWGSFASTHLGETVFFNAVAVITVFFLPLPRSQGGSKALTCILITFQHVAFIWREIRPTNCPNPAIKMLQQHCNMNSYSIVVSYMNPGSHTPLVCSIINLYC